MLGTGWPKKIRTHILFDKKFFFFTNILSVAGHERWTFGWSFAAIVAPKMSWANQQKIFSLGTYFATKSYQSVQIQFRKLFHCRNFPPKSRLLVGLRSAVIMGMVVELFFKAIGGTYSGRKYSARKLCPIERKNTPQWLFCHSESLAVSTHWFSTAASYWVPYYSNFSSVLAFLACPCTPLSFRVLGCVYALIS